METAIDDDTTDEYAKGWSDAGAEYATLLRLAKASLLAAHATLDFVQARILEIEMGAENYGVTNAAIKPN